MLKNITLSAEKLLIENARKKAQSEHSTLNAQFRQWLNQYINSGLESSDYEDLMDSLQHVNSDKKFNRDEMNER